MKGDRILKICISKKFPTKGSPLELEIWVTHQGSRARGAPSAIYNLPHPGVLFTKQSCRGVRASGEQARWKGRGQEAGPKGGDPGENRRL